MCLQACEQYKAIHESLDIAVNRDLWAVAKKVEKESVLVKVCHALMADFNRELSLEDLRTSVQASVRELRLHDLKEKECLHRVLLQRVTMAMALRK